MGAPCKLIHGHTETMSNDMMRQKINQSSCTGLTMLFGDRDIAHTD